MHLLTILKVDSLSISMGILVNHGYLTNLKIWFTELISRCSYQHQNLNGCKTLDTDILVIYLNILNWNMSQQFSDWPKTKYQQNVKTCVWMRPEIVLFSCRAVVCVCVLLCWGPPHTSIFLQLKSQALFEEQGPVKYGPFLSPFSVNNQFK